ncbi:MAG: histidine phosphatase family protein [Candidatus Nanopelagicaceae bacterium]
MGTVILIRHARSTANAEAILAGQSPGVRLDPTGLEQSKKLAHTLGAIPVSRVFVSPLERCMDTIAPWLAEFGNGVSVQSEPRIIEPNYGLWSGRKLEELALESLWSDVQQNPAQVIFPNGEKFMDVWERVHKFFIHLKEIASEDGTYIVVSHGDIIKFLIANILNIEFKNFQSLVVEPGSISIAQFVEGNARLLQYNRSEQDINSFVGNLSKPTLGGEQHRGTKHA